MNSTTRPALTRHDLPVNVTHAEFVNFTEGRGTLTLAQVRTLEEAGFVAGYVRPIPGKPGVHTTDAGRKYAAR